MIIKIDDTIRLELISDEHAQPIFDVVDKNRAYLRAWLPFVDAMQTVAFAENFVRGTMHRNSEGHEYDFVIMDCDVLIGRIGVYKIDPQNKIGEIGYWLAESHQGKGIVTKSCRSLLHFCFVELLLNRIEIKCGTENTRSATIPEKLHFKHEGIIRDGEQLYGRFIDLNLYAILKKDFLGTFMFNK